MGARRMRSLLPVPFLLGASLCTAHAAVMEISVGMFPTSPAVITFDGLADGTEVNGLTVGGVLFNYSLGNAAVVIDNGPGVTNNINPPNIVSIDSNIGTLTLTLSGPFVAIGYGYALINTIPIVNATTITLFSGATNVGTLSYNGFPDPDYTGQFAGIQSTIPFDRVQLTFNSQLSLAFALDNIRLSSAVPEPSAVVLVLTGAFTLFRSRRRPPV